MNLEQVTMKLEQYGQEHLLRYMNELPARERESLCSQIMENDFSVLGHIHESAPSQGREVISPVRAMTLEEIAENMEGLGI